MSRLAAGDRRRGVLLLVVLVVVALLSIANLRYFDWTFAERRAADAAARQEQAYAAAESAVEFLRVYLAEDAATIDQDGGWHDNPARFRAMLVGDSPLAELRVRAAVVAPRWGSFRLEGGRFGLEDESGRLNLSTLLVAETREPGAGRRWLLALPGMTEAIADAILDWLDEDDMPRSLGAERDYYTSLPEPLLPANGPAATLEQLLRVKGVTPELLWGVDQDRNHLASSLEAAQVPLPIDNASGELDGGWASLVTLHSAEANVQADGSPKINVNTDDLRQLHADVEQAIGREAANFVVAYRQGGPEQEDPAAAGADGTGGAEGEGAGEGAPSEQPTEVKALGADVDAEGVSLEKKPPSAIEIDFEAPAAVAVNDLLELVAVTVRVVEAGQLQPALVDSPWQEGDGSLASGLADLMDKLSTTGSPSIAGRVNINQAPRSVLAGIPGMPPAAVEAILANRDPAAGATRPERRHATWLLAEGYLRLEEMRAISPYVTGQGAVFRAQVVGGYEAGGPVRRLEVVLDTTKLPPRVLSRRDLSALGAGFDPALTLAPEVVAP